MQGAGGKFSRTLMHCGNSSSRTMWKYQQTEYRVREIRSDMPAGLEHFRAGAAYPLFVTSLPREFFQGQDLGASSGPRSYLPRGREPPLPMAKTEATQRHARRAEWGRREGEGERGCTYPWDDYACAMLEGLPSLFQYCLVCVFYVSDRGFRK